MILTTVTAYLMSVHCNHNYIIWSPCRKGSYTGAQGPASQLTAVSCSAPHPHPLVNVGTTSAESYCCSAQIGVFTCWLGKSPKRWKIQFEMSVWNKKKVETLALHVLDCCATSLGSAAAVRAWLVPVKGRNLWICAF